MGCTFIAPSATAPVAITSGDLIDERGRNAKVIDWLEEITADCPKRVAHSMNDQCGARCPDLPMVTVRISFAGDTNLRRGFVM